MSDFKIIVPESTTNLITNPSAEEATTGWTATGGSRARSTAQAARGYASIAVTPTAGTADGVYYGTISLTIGLTYTMSVDVLGVAGVPYRIYFASTAGVVLGTPYEFVGTGAWQRVEVTYTETSTTTRRVYIVKNNSASTGVFYVDGLQVEAKAYATTYCDGDIVGHRDDGYQWTGARHASTSTRHEQERSGGRVRDIVDDLSVSSVKATGIGVPDEVLHTEDLSLLPGALYQTSKVGPRYIDLEVVFQGTSIANLHTRRKAFRQAIKRNKTTPDQPFRLRYTGGDTDLEIDALYASGLGQNSLSKYVERAAVRLFCAQPYWRGIGERAAALSTRQSVSNGNWILQRSAGGDWGALGSGSGDSGVWALAILPNGDLIAAGDFTSMGGVSNTRGIARWNGSSWNAMGTGAGNNAVYALAVMPNGDLIATGSFTSMGGVANTTRIARWNGSSWAALGTGLGSTGQALAVMPNGDLMAGGLFTTAGGGAANRIAKWNGSAWSALGTGLGDACNALAVMPNGDLVATGPFTTAGGTSVGYIAKWNGSAWSGLGTGLSGAGVGLAVAPNGDLYCTGGFTTAGGNTVNNIARWNGSSWSAMGTGLNDTGYYVFFDNEDTLWVSGVFTTAGGITVDGLAKWTGVAWLPAEQITFAASYIIRAGAASADGKFTLGWTGSSASVDKTGDVTTLTYNGTADTYPKFIAIGPGRLYYLVNYTIGGAIYFDLTLLSGETVTLDLNPEKIRFVSSFRGNIINKILAGSDVSKFRLQEGVNVIGLFLNDASASAYLVWPEMFEAADG